MITESLVAAKIPKNEQINILNYIYTYIDLEQVQTQTQAQILKEMVYIKMLELSLTTNLTEKKYLDVPDPTSDGIKLLDTKYRELSNKFYNCFYETIRDFNQN